METENKDMKAEPTEAQLELMKAQQKERDEFWKAVQDVLEKYQYRFSVAVNISDQRGVGFIIDILKLPPAQPEK